MNLEKIRNLPEGRKKIIFWSLMVLIGLILVSIYILSIGHSIKKFNSANVSAGIKIPDFREELKNLPNLEISTTTQEELKQLEEEIQKNEAENQTSTLEQQATTTEQ
jgi:hypothetical protein